MVYMVVHKLSLYCCPDVLCLDRGILTNYKWYFPCILWCLEDCLKRVNLDRASDDEGREEFKVNISGELVRINEEGMWLVISVSIPRGQVMMIGMGKNSDLTTGFSQSSRYLTVLAPGLPCQKVSESLQYQGCGHLYYHRDGVLLEQSISISFQFSGV